MTLESTFSSVAACESMLKKEVYLCIMTLEYTTCPTCRRKVFTLFMFRSAPMACYHTADDQPDMQTTAFFLDVHVNFRMQSKDLFSV